MSVKKQGETTVRTSMSIPFLLGSPKLCPQAKNCTGKDALAKLQLTLTNKQGKTRNFSVLL